MRAPVGAPSFVLRSPSLVSGLRLRLEAGGGGADTARLAGHRHGGARSPAYSTVIS
jgi:hypothetical protein